MPDVNGGPLAAFAADVHSQCGEDGILAEILRRLGDLDHWAVEFGAWDGVMMSNTAALAERGWERVLIEGDPAKHQELVRRYAGDSSTIAIRGMVGWEGRQALDSLLAATPVPEDFDVLSIDIDGNDYHAWAAVERYNPKVVIVEFNPTVRNGVRYVQPRDSAINRGCSISSLNDLAVKKGYRLVAATEFNGFFVREDLLPRVGVRDNEPETLRTDTSWQAELFFGFDGVAMIRGGRGLFWHRASVPPEVRMVPRLFVGFPGSFGRVRWLAFRLWAEARYRLRGRRRR